MSEHTKAYSDFFTSPAGLEFLRTVDVLIESQHTSAEDKPDMARDYVQRAKGIREVINHINSVSAERKSIK